MSQRRDNWRRATLGDISEAGDAINYWCK